MKYFNTLLILVTVFLCSIAGCGTENEEVNEQEQSSETAEEQKQVQNKEESKNKLNKSMASAEKALPDIKSYLLGEYGDSRFNDVFLREKEGKVEVVFVVNKSEAGTNLSWEEAVKNQISGGAGYNYEVGLAVYEATKDGTWTTMVYNDKEVASEYSVVKE